MGLYNSDYLLEASEFPCALELVFFILSDLNYASHSTLNFSCQMNNDTTTLKHSDMLKHSLVGAGWALQQGLSCLLKTSIVSAGESKFSGY